MKKRLMKLNHFLAKPIVIAITVIVMTVVLFLLCNYILNGILQLPSLLDGGRVDYGLKNAIDFSHLRSIPIFYIVFLLIVVITDLRYIYLVRTAFKDLNIGQKGVARWTSLDEVKEQYKAVPEKSRSFQGAGGVPVCWNENKIYIDDSPVNNLIIGITRSGKGEMFVFPTIDIYSRSQEKPSLIVTDPKLELYAAAKETLEKRGYDVQVLNLVNPLQSMGFNPLQLIIDAYKAKDYSQAELLCSSFCYSIFNPDEGEGDSQFWANTSTYCLSALILAHVDDCLRADEELNAKNEMNFIKRQKNFSALEATEKEKISIALKILNLKQSGFNKQETATRLNCDINSVNEYWNNTYNTEYELPDSVFIPTDENEKKITMYSVINTFTQLATVRVDEYTTALDIYFRERPELDRAKLKYMAAQVAGERTKSSIFANTLAKLTIFTYEEIAKMTAESTLDLKSIGFGKKPVAVFLGIPDYDRSNHFIASVFIRQLYFVLSKSATLTKSGKCERKVVFVLDEFGNLPAIENMGNIITVCLGRNIRFNLVIQSYSQVEKLYGKDAETIIGNCGNQIYILTNDEETAKKYSSLIGSETITTLNRMGGKMEFRKNYTEMYDEKPLLNPNELMELHEGECVVKRVMKRTDRNGKAVTPTPIFNKGATKFKYRYQYMIDDFPNRSISEIDTPSRRHIDLTSRTFDIMGYFEKKNVAKKESALSSVKTNARCETIVQMLQNLGLHNNARELTYEEMIVLLNEAVRQGSITMPQKESVMSLLVNSETEE